MAHLKPLVSLFLGIFSSIGLIQVRFGPDRQLEVIKSSRVVIPILLLIYWLNAVFVFYFDRPPTDQISFISNVIQLSLNSVMISVAMVLPIKYMHLARKIISQVEKLSTDLERLLVPLNHRRLRRSFLVTVSFFFAFLVYFTAYDGFVSCRNGTVTVKYWFITILPSIYMVLVLTQAICVLGLLRFFYKSVNKSIAKQIPSDDEGKKVLLSPGKPYVSFIGDQGKPGVPDQFIPDILNVLGDMTEICQRVEGYYGPLFLSTFTTIFVVTSIQLYYCYQIIIQADETRGYSYWSLVMCLNVVVINILLVVTITALCQSIQNQSKKSIRYVRKLQSVGSLTKTGKEVQVLVRETQFDSHVVEFTALNFFSLDYSMLCGMVGAITTYLIIYIQFSNVYTIQGSDHFAGRNKFQYAA